MRPLLRALPLVLPLAFLLAPAAFAQVQTGLPPRAVGAGVGSLALENDVAAGALYAPTAGAPRQPMVGGGYVRDTFEVDYEFADVEFTNSGPQLFGLFPLAGGKGLIGVNVTLLGTESDIDAKSDTTSTYESELEQRRIEISGAARFGQITAGLTVTSTTDTDESTDSYDSGSGTTPSTTKEKTESEGNVNQLGLGVAFEPSKQLRLAAHYAWKAVERYKGERKSTVSTGATSTTTETDTPELLVQGAHATLGATIDIGGPTVVLGLRRDVPYDEHYEITRNIGTGVSSSGTTETSAGATTLSAGVETVLARGTTLAGNLHNQESKDIEIRGLAVSLAQVAGPVTISPALGYDLVEIDGGDGEDAEGKRLTIALALAAAF